jgi:hypothetical protein
MRMRKRERERESQKKVVYGVAGAGSFELLQFNLNLTTPFLQRAAGAQSVEQL